MRVREKSVGGGEKCRNCAEWSLLLWRVGLPLSLSRQSTPTEFDFSHFMLLCSGRWHSFCYFQCGVLSEMFTKVALKQRWRLGSYFMAKMLRVEISDVRWDVCRGVLFGGIKFDMFSFDAPKQTFAQLSFLSLSDKSEINKSLSNWIEMECIWTFWRHMLTEFSMLSVFPLQLWCTLSSNLPSTLTLDSCVIWTLKWVWFNVYWMYGALCCEFQMKVERNVMCSR